MYSAIHFKIFWMVGGWVGVGVNYIKFIWISGFLKIFTKPDHVHLLLAARGRPCEAGERGRGTQGKGRAGEEEAGGTGPGNRWGAPGGGRWVVQDWEGNGPMGIRQSMGSHAWSCWRIIRAGDQGSWLWIMDHDQGSWLYIIEMTKDNGSWPGIMTMDHGLLPGIMTRSLIVTRDYDNASVPGIMTGSWIMTRNNGSWPGITSGS